jgi:hypothetical protein
MAEKNQRLGRKKVNRCCRSAVTLRGPNLFFGQTYVSFQSHLKRKNGKAAPLPLPEPARRVTWSHVVLVVSGMVLMFLAESLFWPGRGLAWTRARGVLNASAAAKAGKTPVWGNIEYTSIALDRPEEYFTNELSRQVKTVWVFRNHTEQQLNALFGTFDLPRATLAQFTNRAHWEILPRAIRVSPPAEIVAAMAPDTRQRLYALLAQNPENILQVTPFHFREHGFEEWFADCGLSKERIELVRKMTYVQEGHLCFADAPAFSQLCTPDETRALLKCLWRVPTFVMKLRIDPGTDVDAVMKYWGKFGAEKNYKPLIESMSRVESGSALNISYFLPPFARLRLYTYPDPRDPNIVREDCFWSAMNFFNTTPDNGFFNSDYTQKILGAEYTRVRDNSREFGDLLMLLGQNRQALHMCVYLADDVVFTKNGFNTQQPWVLLKISEMLVEYEKNKPFEVIAYRRKAPP